MLNVMSTKGGILRPVQTHVQCMVHNMMCKEGKTSKILAAAGIAYIVVCNEVYERRNYEENSDSQGYILVYEMHKVVFRCRFKCYNSTSTPIQLFTATHTATHSSGQYASAATSAERYTFCKLL